jgi:hypothetical protein
MQLNDHTVVVSLALNRSTSPGSLLDGNINSKHLKEIDQ